MLLTGSFGKYNVGNPFIVFAVVISNPDVYTLGKLIAFGPLSFTAETLTVEPDAYVIVLESAASSQRFVDGKDKGVNTAVKVGYNLNRFVEGRFPIKPHFLARYPSTC